MKLQLRKADKKFKSGKTTEYQFKDAAGNTTLIILEKLKSGYSAEVRSADMFKHTDGLSTIKSVQSWINNLKK